MGSVLELGCGHGLPGIVAMSRGCSQAVFTDYNEDVSFINTLVFIINM